MQGLQQDEQSPSYARPSPSLLRPRSVQHYVTLRSLPSLASQDNSTVGIRATLARLSQLLRAHDEELWEHLDKGLKINPQFYAFRCVDRQELVRHGYRSTWTTA